MELSKKYLKVKAYIIGIIAFIILCSFGYILDNTPDIDLNKKKNKEEEIQYTVGDDGLTTFYQDDFPDLKYGHYEDGSPKYLPATGCGPTSFSMVASIISGKIIDPVTVVSWSGDDYYLVGAGTYFSFFQAAADNFDLNCNVLQISPSNQNTFNLIDESLEKGIPVICSQGPGLFTKGGHFIVIASKDKDGKYHVKDPNKNNAVNKDYDHRQFEKDEIDSTASLYFIFSPK